MRKKSFLLLGFGILVLFCFFGSGLAEAANADLIDGGVGLSSVDDTLKRLAHGIVAIARPIVAVMTAIAGTMAILNVGDSKRPMWYAILGIGLLLNLGDVLWAMWGKYANPSAGLESAIEYSIQIKDTTNADGNGEDILSTFMRYYLEIIVTGAERIKPIAIKLLLILALIDASIRLALDLTEKDKLAWMVKTFLRIGFYVFLIQHWIGIDGLNLMDTLSKGFQEIGFMAGNYGHALPTSVKDIGSMAAKDNLSPDSIVNNGFKMISAMFGGAGSETPSVPPGDTGVLDKAKEILDATKRGFAIGISTQVPGVQLMQVITMVVSIICIFLTGIEMFMARIEFYTLALLGIPLLAFGAIKHFEYLAQQTIRAMFNCGVKVCVISFLQAVICRMYTKYTNNLIDAQTGLFKDIHILDNFGHLMSATFQLMLVALIMYLIVSKVPKLIQALLSGNPSLGGSDMTGTAIGVATTAASTASMVAGAQKAAANAKIAAAEGRDVAPWKMSAMKQFGAALMRRAPVIGPAYSAYNEIVDFRKNDNQGDRDGARNTRPVTNPSTQKPGQKPGTNPSPSSTPAGPGGGDAPQKAGGMYVDSSPGAPNTDNTAVQGYEGTAPAGDNTGNTNVKENHGADVSGGVSELRKDSTPPPPESLNTVDNPSASSIQYRSPSAPLRPIDSITNNFGKAKRRKFLEPPK